jgi:hypothetical protein
MYIHPMEKEFEWVKKIIDSVNSVNQINSCENLISLFKIRNWSDDFNSDDELGYNGLINHLESALKKKKDRYEIE